MQVAPQARNGHGRARRVEAAGDSAAGLAHHAVAAGLAEPAFRHSLAAGREALRILAAAEAVAHFEKARQLAAEATLEGAEFGPDIRDLYLELGQAYEMNNQYEKALAIHDYLGQQGLK